jgi:glycosyltransferase involved in cell wall biosynthesis
MLHQAIVPDSDRPRAHLPIKICHLAMGDGWAGAEVQLAILLASLAKMPDFEISAVLFNEGRLARELRALGIKTKVISESEYNSFSVVKQLIDYFRQHEFDILHTHKYKDNILGALSSIYRGTRRRVRTVHGLPEPFVGFQAVKISGYQVADNWVNRWLVDRILAVSLDLRSHLIKHFGADKVTCIQNAIDIEQVCVTRDAKELKKELDLDENQFLIGTMGRLMPVKGLEFFLKAAQIIRRQKPNVRFVIAGDGPLKGTLQKQAREYGLDKDVLFLGHRNDSHDILGLMDVFVLPSVSEGIPLVLLEALALARPVIASRVGGIPEVIEDGVSGLLVTPGREDELAQSCITLMDNAAFAQQLGVAGRKRIEEQFSARVMAEKVAEVYRTLVCNGESR